MHVGLIFKGQTNNDTWYHHGTNFWVDSDDRSTTVVKYNTGRHGVFYSVYGGGQTRWGGTSVLNDAQIKVRIWK